MPTLAGRLRHRVTFQRQTTVRDSDGVESLAWDDVYLDSDTPLVDWPAEVLTGPGREFLQTGQVRAELAARITCRWFPGLEASWRILHDAEFDSDGNLVAGSIYNVGTWDLDVTGRREYRIRCTAGSNDGA